MSPAQVASVVFTFSSDRRFQLWSYRVSHSQLLLRSVKDAEHTSRIDVLFKGVDALDLPTRLDGLVIENCEGLFALA
jgi:hypothetical protein